MSFLGGSLADDRQAPLALAIRQAHRVVTGAMPPRSRTRRPVVWPIHCSERTRRPLASRTSIVKVELLGTEVEVQVQNARRRHREGTDPIESVNGPTPTGLVTVTVSGTRSEAHPTASTDTVQS